MWARKMLKIINWNLLLKEKLVENKFKIPFKFKIVYLPNYLINILLDPNYISEIF